MVEHTRALRAVAALLMGTAFLVAGAGLLSTLLALELPAVASPLGAGAVLAAYYVGLAAGSFRGELVVRRVGHIRAFAAFAALLVAVVAGHALWTWPAWWAVLRFAGGIAMGGLFLVLESWFSGTATDADRGRLLSLYLVALYGGLAVGQQLVGLPDPDGHVRFLVAVACVALASIPVALTTAVEPALPSVETASPRVAWARAPLALTSSALSGVLTSTWYTVGPVFATETGASDGEVGSFMAAVMGGALVLQVPLGVLSDRVDRRAVIAGIGLAAAGLVGLLVLSGATGWGLLVAALAGGLSFSVYPVAVANSLERVEPDDVLSTSSAMLFAFSIGSAAGPLVAGALGLALGGHALLAVTIGAGVAIGVVGLYRETTAASVEPEDKVSFVPQPHSSPGVAELDPRVDEESVA